MPVHASAFYGTTVDGSAAYAAIPALTDPYLQVATNAVIPPRLLKLLAAAAGSTGITRARIQSAGLLRVAYPQIMPLNAAVTVSAGEPNVFDGTGRPIAFTSGESLEFHIRNAGSAAAFGLLVVGFDHEPVPPGEAFLIRYTSTTAATAGAWKDLALTSAAWEQTLPSGTYAVVGMDHWSATAMAARLVLPRFRHRPGIQARVSAASGPQNPIFMDGSLGVMGYFTNEQLPSVEVACTAADGNHDGLLRVIRIGGPELLPAPTR